MRRWEDDYRATRRAGTAIALAAVLLLAGSTSALTPEQKCVGKKLQAQGKLQLCLRKNAAKVLGGGSDASDACQTKFADALTKAGDCHYLDNGDGTVSDLNTGLVWEKKDDLGGVHDKDNTYSWSESGSAPDGTAFTDFLATLNNGTSILGSTIGGCFAGSCDWRLPTSAELQAIRVLPCVTPPCIDPIFGPTQASDHWSATTESGNPEHAWNVRFIDSLVLEPGKFLALSVRAVRGGIRVPAVHPQPVSPQQKCQQRKLKASGKLQLCLKKNAAKVLTGKPDGAPTCQTKFADALSKAGTCQFLDNGDGTVSDLDTGLVWEKKDDLDGVHDVDTLHSWCVDVVPPADSCDGMPRPDGTAFTDFIGSLDNGVSPDGTQVSGCFADYCDWRLPTILELAAIRNACLGCSPAWIDSTFGLTQASLYWTSIVGAGGPTDAWLVGFNGSFYGGDYITHAYVRAVRGGS